MYSGYYTISSAILTREKEMNVIGNNLTNMQTPGFQSERMVISDFQQELLSRVDGKETASMSTSSASTIATAGGVYPIMEQGIVKETGNQLDFAISGEGYFVVQGDKGERYLTRNGNFERDDDGYLSLRGIGRVLGNDGPIYLPNTICHTESDGTMRQEDGKRIGRLQIGLPNDFADLQKRENGMYQLPDGQAIEEAKDTTVQDKRLEMSNVDMNRELTTMIEAQRAFQACSSALQVIDEMNRKAASQMISL